MECRNFTPFPSLAFEATNEDDHDFHIIATRATLRIRRDGTLGFTEEQEQLVFADSYYGEINKTSVRHESDLAPHKPKCDVIVIGNAYAPGNKPVRSFETCVILADSQKTIFAKQLTIKGPRFWKKRLILPGWKLTRPGKITSLPLRYEYSHGGECRIEANEKAAKRVRKKYRLTPEQRQQYPGGADQAPIAHAACVTNTVGTGYAEKWYLKAKKVRKIPAPQIEAPHDPIKKFRKQYAVQGFGVITRMWQPRLKLAGTYDNAWLKERHPDLPDDFDMAYWNCAHPDMQCSHLRGDETVELINLCRSDAPGAQQDKFGNTRLKFSLPAQRIRLTIRTEAGKFDVCDMDLDTLIVDAEQRKVSLVWRKALPVETDIRVAEAEVMPLEQQAATRKEKFHV